MLKESLVRFVYTEDGYTAMYVDGLLVLEGDCLEAEDVLKAVGIRSIWSYVDEEWFKTHYFPKEYEDVVLE